MQSKHTPPDIRYTEQAETGGPCRHHPAQTPEGLGLVMAKGEDSPKSTLGDDTCE